MRLVIFGLLIETIGSCSLLSYRVEKIDYKSRQAKAAILLSDPQVYSRASLINDRRDETEYLHQLLVNSDVKPDGSSVVNFSPQIVRDLKTVDALSASLGFTIGKSDRTSATDLQDQITAEKLQAQLAVLKKQIEGIESAQAPNVTIPAPTLSQDLTATPSGSAAHVITPDLSTIDAQLKDVQSQVAALAASASAAPNAPSNDYSKLDDPRADFVDRQAYRRDIRAALAETRLDDTHDKGGNALYRLQFEATVLPPNGKTRQWGAAQIEVKPPTITWAQVVDLYYNWLSHITSVLSSRVPGVTHNFDYDRFVEQLGFPSYFSVIDIYANRSGQFHCFFHSTATDDRLKAIDQSGGIPEKGPDGVLYQKIGTYAIPPDAKAPLDTQKYCESYPNPGSSDYPFAKSMPIEAWRLITGWIKKYSVSEVRAEEFSFERAAPLSGATGENRQEYVPKSFCLALVTPDTQHTCNSIDHRGLMTAAGGDVNVSDDYAVRAYSVLPVELVQRLGVTAEASQSLQAALAVAAQTSAVTSGGANLGYLSQSDARSEALARQPLVVGYSGNDPGTEPGPSYFGWLFGPEFEVNDSKTLDLKQEVRNYGVSADVSVPGWWSWMTLSVDTAWVHNWRGASVFDGQSDSKGNSTVEQSIKTISLPLSDATYDALTDFIGATTLGLQNSHIFASGVTPNVIPACTGVVTLQINGTNIWRANSALLGGTPAKAITVLPDMNGILAEFDMSDVMGSLVNSDATVEDLPLTVAAEQGSVAPLDVYVVGRRQSSNGATTCQSPLLAPADLGALPPMVVSWTPTEVCANMRSMIVTVHSLNFPVDRQLEVVSGDGLKGRVVSNSGTEQIVSLQRDDQRGGGSGSGSEALLAGTETVSFALVPTVAGKPEQSVAAGEVLLNVKECKASPDETSTKVILKTTSVKIAKDQAITLLGSVPGSYAKLVLAVRPQSKSGDGTWVMSPSIDAPAGEGVALTAKLDLSSIAAKQGDKLDVAERILNREGGDWQTIVADKAVYVAGN